MFDIVTLKQEIVEYYFDTFISHSKNSLVKEFIRNWIELLEIYCNMPNFIRFDKNMPVLTNLKPTSKSIIIVPFEDDEVNHFANTSVFPVCLFTVYYKNKIVNCKESLNLLLLYIKLVNVKYIAFYKISNYKNLMDKIKEFNSNIICYPPTAFKYFCKLNKIYKY